MEFASEELGNYVSTAEVLVIGDHAPTLDGRGAVPLPVPAAATPLCRLVPELDAWTRVLGLLLNLIAADFFLISANRAGDARLLMQRHCRATSSRLRSSDANGLAIMRRRGFSAAVRVSPTSPRHM